MRTVDRFQQTIEGMIQSIGYCINGIRYGSWEILDWPKSLIGDSVHNWIIACAVLMALIILLVVLWRKENAMTEAYKAAGVYGRFTAAAFVFVPIAGFLLAGTLDIRSQGQLQEILFLLCINGSGKLCADFPWLSCILPY